MLKQDVPLNCRKIKTLRGGIQAPLLYANKKLKELKARRASCGEPPVSKAEHTLLCKTFAAEFRALGPEEKHELAERARCANERSRQDKNECEEIAACDTLVSGNMWGLSQENQPITESVAKDVLSSAMPPGSAGGLSVAAEKLRGEFMKELFVNDAGSEFKLRNKVG